MRPGFTASAMDRVDIEFRSDHRSAKGYANVTTDQAGNQRSGASYCGSGSLAALGIDPSQRGIAFHAVHHFGRRHLLAVWLVPLQAESHRHWLEVFGGICASGRRRRVWQAVGGIDAGAGGAGDRRFRGEWTCSTVAALVGHSAAAPDTLGTRHVFGGGLLAGGMDVPVHTFTPAGAFALSTVPRRVLS